MELHVVLLEHISHMLLFKFGNIKSGESLWNIKLLHRTSFLNPGVAFKFKEGVICSTINDND